MRLIAISFTLLIFTFSFICCGGGKSKQSTNTSVDNGVNEGVNTELLNISETHFGDNWNKLSENKNYISREMYDSLKLNTLHFIEQYEDLQCELGSILINGDRNKLLTIKSISSGEIVEYLLGYYNNNISDSLLVAYEDNVEYFSTTSSVIEANKITVRTINWDYQETEEVSDTIISVYTITPELTFDEIVEE